jgi:hypothetical protein
MSGMRDAVSKHMAGRCCVRLGPWILFPGVVPLGRSLMLSGWAAIQHVALLCRQTSAQAFRWGPAVACCAASVCGCKGLQLTCSTTVAAGQAFDACQVLLQALAATKVSEPDQMNCVVAGVKRGGLVCAQCGQTPAGMRAQLACSDVDRRLGMKGCLHLRRGPYMYAYVFMHVPGPGPDTVLLSTTHGGQVLGRFAVWYWPRHMQLHVSQYKARIDTPLLRVAAGLHGHVVQTHHVWCLPRGTCLSSWCTQGHHVPAMQ